MPKMGFVYVRRRGSSTRYMNKSFVRWNYHQSNKDGMGMQHAPRDAEHISFCVGGQLNGSWKSSDTWTDYKTNAQIVKELKITAILDRLLEYKRSWLHHVNRMPRNKITQGNETLLRNWQKESW